MIRLTQFAIREKSVIILLAVGVLLAGVFSWGTLRQELLPDIEVGDLSKIALERVKIEVPEAEVDEGQYGQESRARRRRRLGGRWSGSTPAYLAASQARS